MSWIWHPKQNNFVLRVGRLARRPTFFAFYGMLGGGYGELHKKTKKLPIKQVEILAKMLKFLHIVLHSLHFNEKGGKMKAIGGAFRQIYFSRGKNDEKAYT